MGPSRMLAANVRRIQLASRVVLILGDLPVLSCHLNESLVVDIVDVADRRKLKAGKWFDVRQDGSVKIEVMESNCSESGRNNCYANQQVNDATLPTPSV